MIEQEKRDLIAQWAFDTRPILGRFHLWLEDVEIDWTRGESAKEFTKEISFLEGRMERLFAITAAVTSLGTQLFGRYGHGANLDKFGLNQVKKDADAISAYAMSESLWFLSRQLPENHAIMVCLGEGLMPKAGETPEMGSNPQLGFGRIYARPEVVRWLDKRVIRLLNDPTYKWEDFYGEIKSSGKTVWGTAIDTLENTTRFAKGDATGPMTVLHLFNQPLHIAKPYETYVGNLFIPREVAAWAISQSILISFHTPRKLVVKAILGAYPGISPSNIHVWTLGGKSRGERIEGLWREWLDMGVHIIEDGWTLPTRLNVFTDSGTYAPTYKIGTWKDKNDKTHLFICDGYAASAEALQAASLAPMLGVEAYLSVFTSKFKLTYDKERHLIQMDVDDPDFPNKLTNLIGKELDSQTLEYYRNLILEGQGSGIPYDRPFINANDFFPEKSWEGLAITGFMRPDPYSGEPGVEKIKDDLYRVTVRLTASKGEKRITFTLRLMEDMEESFLVFNPLLNRFMAGEDFTTRPVKISDSGRIRNELQTLCSDALEFIGDTHILVHFDRISTEVIPPANQERLLEILKWYKKRHPIWFSWLEIRFLEKN
ncbi:MAG: hypothetical protein KDK90_20640 [Leptospiraceae bacterium]|nr:hypothetical protein [Leptospiraceae bacterium]